DRTIKKPAHSLAGLLPPGLAATINLAAGADRDVTWDSFAIRVVRDQIGVTPELDGGRTGVRPESGRGRTGVRPESGRDRTGVVQETDQLAVQPPTTSGSRASAGYETGATPTSDHGVTSSRLAGTLVHRLFERRLPVATSEHELRQLIPQIVRSEERIDVDDEPALAQTVASLYLALRQRADVTGLLASGTCHYEVPFSYQPMERPDSPIRGVIDCLIAAPDGRVTVLEFKTGRPRPEHDAQAALYGAAMEALLGPNRVAVKIVYP
ncbi:MAG TPA: PD-(D/E)XK nuclease family protein, partial [Vicinamibacterales bacterium]|nr:PD-(D/E)XK nuclease family protein [Vicinamibacterales bacterium]